MSEHLPKIDPELVHSCQEEYDSAFKSGSSQQLIDGARCRLVWAMAHSSDPQHHKRALELAQAQLASKTGDVKEYRYLAAVACYQLGKNVEARRELSTLLQAHRDFRQAEFLKALVEDAIVKDGLVGMGIAGAVAAVGVAILVGAMRRS